MIKVVRWFFGLGWLVGGLGVMSDTTVVGGFLLALGGLLVLPPTFHFLAKAIGKPLTRPIKVVATIAVLACGFAIISPKLEAKEKAKKELAANQEAEKKKQEQLAYERLTPAQKDSAQKAKVRLENEQKEAAARAAIVAEQKARREKLESQFSAYDGSHPGVERAIKARMNDPDSYEHVSTRFREEGDHIKVYTTFRGKNAFNAKILSSATADVDYSGHVLDLNM